MIGRFINIVTANKFLFSNIRVPFVTYFYPNSYTAVIMREAQFLKQNIDKWKLYENEIKLHENADKLADRFIELTDDLSYSKTFYPNSATTKYLNGLATLFHQNIYKNKN